MADQFATLMAGRKSWLFSDTVEGARASIVILVDHHPGHLYGALADHAGDRDRYTPVQEAASPPFQLAARRLVLSGGRGNGMGRCTLGSADPCRSDDGQAPGHSALLIYQFARSENGIRIFLAFLALCTALLALSWLNWIDPRTVLPSERPIGVPIKNWITQGVEFVLCIFGAAGLAIVMLQKQRRYAALGFGALAFAFLLNVAFVASSRSFRSFC
jgi:hypothetical protein